MVIVAPVLGVRSVCARCVEQHSSQVIAIAAPVLGGPEVVRVVLNSSSSQVRVVLNSSSSQVLGGPEVVRVVLNSSSSSQVKINNLDLT